MHNLISNVVVTQAITPQLITSSALNTGNIDLQGAEDLTLAVLVGDIADTTSGSVKVAFKLEHADDDGTGAPGAYGSCADADVLNFTSLSSGVFLTVDAAGKESKRYVIGYRGGKRFVKLTATPTGLTNGGPIAVVALKNNIAQLPVDNT